MSLNFAQIQKKALIASFLLFAIVLIQQGPAILGTLVRLPLNFSEVNSSEYVARLDGLSPGDYYLSLGRVLTETEVLIDGTVLAKDTLSLSTPISIERPNESHLITIKLTSSEYWRSNVYDFPILSRYGVGVVIQAWRGFNGVCLGPIFSLLLLISVLAYSRISDEFATRLKPHFIMALVGLSYTFYVSGIPDLFWGYELNTIVQVLLRVAFSAALLYLVGAYSRMPRFLLWLHVPCAIELIFAATVRPEWLIPSYRLQIGLFGVFLLIATRTFYIYARGRHAELLSHLCLVWVILHIFSVMVYWTSGASYLTVWSPSFMAVLACIEFYLIYRESIDLVAQAEAAQHAFLLASQVAHDIRSPMAALRTLLLGAKSLDGDEQTLATLAFDRINKIVQDILLEHRSTNRNEVLYGLVTPLVTKIVKEKQLEFSDAPKIEVEISDYCDFPVKFDPRQLERVISNLINNARDVSPVGKPIEIRISTIKDYAKIAFRDFGPGIPADVLESIKGYHIKSTKISGNGLGLSHAFSCVAQWEGKVEFESKADRGTTVTLYLLRK